MLCYLHRYEGGGLVRKAFISHTPTSLRFVPDGVFAQSDTSTIPASGHNVTIVPTAEVRSDTSVLARVQYALVDMDTGNTVARSSTPVTPVAGAGPATAQIGAIDGGGAIDEGATILRSAALFISRAKLWSLHSPAQYMLSASLVNVSSNHTVDALNITIGLRHIDWNAPGGGFALNGVPLHLRGFSHHQDFGGVGAAVPDRVNLFRVNALRSVGGNTWRTSHNP